MFFKHTRTPLCKYARIELKSEELLEMRSVV